jgi:hypothetical protein
VVTVADANPTLARILAEHGPLHEDDITRQLQDSGVVDPDAAIDELRYETTYPARQLVDDRWVWLPTVLAGRVFTHRLCADELAHDILAVTPDLGPITELCDHGQYGRFADGSSAQLVLAEYDDELFEQRGIPPEAIDPAGALLLEPGTLHALGVAEGELIGLRLTAAGLVFERVSTPADSAVGARLAAMLDDEPVFFAAAAWTACVDDAALFTEPLPPLCEIVDDHGLAQNGDWLAPGEFDFDRWRLEIGCAMLAKRHDLDPDEAFVLYSLVRLYGQISLLIDEGEPPEHASAAVEDTETPADALFTDFVGEIGAALADPLLAELLVAETVDVDGAGAPALGLFADVLEPKVPRSARVACRWLRAVALERIGDIDAAERELLAAESTDPDWPLALRDL